MADITQHTPTPWSIGSSNPGEGHVIESDSADRTIAWTANSYCASNDEEYISQEDEANAEFIVRACNSHDALLEALELYDSFSKANDDWRQMVRNLLNSDDTPEVVIKAREAIAKAKGGA